MTIIFTTHSTVIETNITINYKNDDCIILPQNTQKQRQNVRVYNHENDQNVQLVFKTWLRKNNNLFTVLKSCF